MGRLTTHVLDTMAGAPAAGLAIEPWTVGENARWLETAIASPDGRTGAPPIEGGALVAERCAPCFRAGDSLCTRGIDPDPRLLDEILIRFGVADFDLPCHLPLPISACGCSSRRGG